MGESDNTLVNSMLTAFKQMKQEENASRYEASIAASALEQHKRATGEGTDQKAILDALNSLNQRLSDIDKNNKEFSQLNKDLATTVDGIGKMSDRMAAEKIRGNNAGFEEQMRQFGVFASMVQNEFKQRTNAEKTYPVQSPTSNQPQAQHTGISTTDDTKGWLSRMIQELRSDTASGIENNKKSNTNGGGTGISALAAKSSEDTARQAIETAEKNNELMFKTNTERPTIVLLKRWLERRMEKEDDEGSGNGNGNGGGGGGGIPWWAALLGLGAGLLPGATGGYLGNLMVRASNWMTGKTDAKAQNKKIKAENKKAVQEHKAKVKDAEAGEKAAKEELKRAKAEEKAAKQEAKNAKANEKAAKTEVEQQKAKSETQKANEKAKAAKEQTRQAKQNVKKANVNTAEVKANTPKTKPQVNPQAKIPGANGLGKALKVAGRVAQITPGVFAGIEAAGKAADGDTFGATTAATKGVIDTALNFNAVTATGNLAMTGAMAGLKALGIADASSPETLGELVQYTADGLKQNSGWIFGDERKEQIESMTSSYDTRLFSDAKIGIGRALGSGNSDIDPLAKIFTSTERFAKQNEALKKLGKVDAEAKTSVGSQLFNSIFQGGEDKTGNAIKQLEEKVQDDARLFAMQYQVLCKDYGEDAVKRMLSGEGGAEAMQEYVQKRYDASNPNFQKNLEAAKEKIGAQIRGEIPTAPTETANGQPRDEVQSQMAAASPENTPEAGRETTETPSAGVDVDKATGGVTEESMRAACYDGFLNALLDPRVLESNAQNNEAIGHVLSRVMVG